LPQVGALALEAALTLGEEARDLERPGVGAIEALLGQAIRRDQQPVGLGVADGEAVDVRLAVRLPLAPQPQDAPPEEQPQPLQLAEQVAMVGLEPSGARGLGFVHGATVNSGPS
jgi:hypothetical protein